MSLKSKRGFTEHCGIWDSSKEIFWDQRSLENARVNKVKCIILYCTGVRLLRGIADFRMLMGIEG